VNGRVLGLSHKRKGQFFALDASTGAAQWTSPGGQGENAALVVTGDSVLALKGDGTLLALPHDGGAFSPARESHVGESATYAHPVPTGQGLLIKDESGLALYAPATAKTASRPGTASKGNDR
jgi:outer membrane protein assembly factor BamB